MTGGRDRRGDLGAKQGFKARAATPQKPRSSLIRRIPVVGLLYFEWRAWRTDATSQLYTLAPATADDSRIQPYALDMAPLLDLPHGQLDDDGIPYNKALPHVPATYHPTTIAQYALARWNAYAKTGDEAHLASFLAQARWLAEHALPLADGAVGWPMPFENATFYAAKPWLSALTQGVAISVLARAYQVTGESEYRRLAERAVRTFEHDILDGGVASVAGPDGLFFEEVAAYPAAHILNGYGIALFGLYDYVAATGDMNIAGLIERSLEAFHAILDAFDTGYWTRYDLLTRRLASRFYHHLHITILQALARSSGCRHCAETAARWETYARKRRTRMRYFFATRAMRYRHALHTRTLQRLYRRKPANAERDDRLPVCIPVTAFPVPGGIRSVVSSIVRSTSGHWRVEMLTARKGADAAEFAIETFGGTATHPSQFPNVWLYAYAGARKLQRLLRRGRAYRLLLPQDGVATNAYAAFIGRMAGIRVVAMDHGSTTLPWSKAFRAERLAALKTQPIAKRLLARLRYRLLWPSLRRLARAATKRTDLFLTAGPDVDAAYTHHLGVHPSRIMHYPVAVDTERYAPMGEEARAALRARWALPSDAIVAAMVCRLSPEKGITVALEGVSRALEQEPPGVRARLCVVIAGDGPLREQIEGEVRARGLADVCLLPGALAPDAVSELLALADIFLYTSTRGAATPVALLEAMSAGCAVIASRQPESNAQRMAEGRGLAIPAGDAGAVADALLALLRDPDLRRDMSARARAYITERHSLAALARCLLRAGYFMPDVTSGTLEDVHAWYQRPVESARRVAGLEHMMAERTHAE